MSLHINPKDKAPLQIQASGHRKKHQEGRRLFRRLVLLQARFTKAKTQNEPAFKSSSILAAEAAKSAQPFAEGELFKKCLPSVQKKKVKHFYM